MRFTMIYPAAEGEVFASDAFTANVGKSITIRVNEGTADEHVESGVLVDAEVAADGKRVAFTFEGPEGLLGDAGE